MARIDELPDDPMLLKQMVLERDVLIERIKNEAADRLEEQVEAVRQRMEAEKKAAIEATGEAPNQVAATIGLLISGNADERTTHLNRRHAAKSRTQNSWRYSSRFDRVGLP